MREWLAVAAVGGSGVGRMVSVEAALAPVAQGVAGSAVRVSVTKPAAASAGLRTYTVCAWTGFRNDPVPEVVQRAAEAFVTAPESVTTPSAQTEYGPPALAVGGPCTETAIETHAEAPHSSVSQRAEYVVGSAGAGMVRGDPVPTGTACALPQPARYQRSVSPVPPVLVSVMTGTVPVQRVGGLAAADSGATGMGRSVTVTAEHVGERQPVTASRARAKKMVVSDTARSKLGPEPIGTAAGSMGHEPANHSTTWPATATDDRVTVPGPQRNSGVATGGEGVLGTGSIATDTGRHSDWPQVELQRAR
jgi:hypothetical protein